MLCVNEKKFSFRWIEKQFVQVHPGENVIESSGVSRDKAELVGVRDVQLGVISVRMVFEGFFLDHRAKKRCIESEKEWAKYGTLGVHHRKE